MGSPIIIIGSPRSGTSVIARLLQEELGVMMDEKLPLKKISYNLNGDYEDQQLAKINRGALSRWKFGVQGVKPVDKIWLTQFDKWVKRRKKKFDKWGFKDPAMIGFINWVKDYFDKATYIYTTRTIDQMIASQMRVVGTLKPVARMGILAYAKMIQGTFSMDELNVFDLSKHVPEKELIEKLKGIVNGR